MKTVPTGHPAPRSRPEAQFGLASLLGFVTVCAVLSALAGAIGISASVLLMLMSLALWARQGWLAMAMLLSASLAADLPLPTPGVESTIVRQVLVFLSAAVLCGWYRLRRKDV